MWIQNWTSNDPLTFYLLTSSMKHIYSLFIPVGLWLHKEKQLLASVIDVFIGSDYPCCCASYLLNTHTQKKNLKSTALKHTSYVFLSSSLFVRLLGFGLCCLTPFLFTFFMSSSSPSCFLCSCICWLCPVPTPAFLPTYQRVQKAAKIKKKAVCNLGSCSFHSHFFIFIAFLPVRVSSVTSSPICVSRTSKWCHRFQHLFLSLKKKRSCRHTKTLICSF